MNKPLPLLFLKRIQQENPPLFAYFSSSERRTAYKGIRLNTSKPTPPSFLERLRPVSWCPLGYYINEKLGTHPFHQAGMFYIQEPSAMAVVELMNIQQDDVVLDCSAAPGGKSTHIASYLGEQGFLWSHDVNRSRAQQLVFNLERMGFTRFLVSTGPLEQMTSQQNLFTKILVDAPCSGEGMFNKDEGAIDQWSESLVQHCATLQMDILDQVVPLLKPGGELTYSTCTFSSLENELQILRFLERNPTMERVDDPYLQLFNQVVTNGVGAKILPNEREGEGHYLVKLKKKGVLIKSTNRIKPTKAPKEWYDFQKRNDIILPKDATFLVAESRLYLSFHDFNRKGISILRDGLCLGEIKPYGFIPDHALSHANFVKLPQYNLELSSPLLTAYLKGESFPLQQKDGWWVVSVHNQGLGWIKIVKGVAKNHFPKGLRLHFKNDDELVYT